MAGALLFVGGNVFTGHGRRSRPAALAVREGRIVAVGAPAEARAAAGPGAEVVDLAGGLLTPRRPVACRLFDRGRVRRPNRPR